MCISKLLSDIIFACKSFTSFVKFDVLGAATSKLSLAGTSDSEKLLNSFTRSSKRVLNNFFACLSLLMGSNFFGVGGGSYWRSFNSREHSANRILFISIKFDDPDLAACIFPNFLFKDINKKGLCCFDSYCGWTAEAAVRSNSYMRIYDMWTSYDSILRVHHIRF